MSIKKNYIVIQGWMIQDLQLSGNELLAYALIYGFSQDGEGEFKGSLSYLSSFLCVSKRNTIEILKRLVDKQLVTKKESIEGGVKRVSYVANITSSDASITTSDGSITDVVMPASPPIPYISLNKEDNIYKEKDITKVISKKKVPKESSAKEKVVNEEFEKFKDYILKHAPRVANMKRPFTEEEFIEVKTKYNPVLVRDTLLNMDNYTDLHKNVSAYRTLINWISRNDKRTISNNKTTTEPRESEQSKNGGYKRILTD